MQFSLSYVIKAPSWFVWECLFDEDLAKFWVKDLQQVKLLSGQPGQIGSQNVQTYQKSPEAKEVVVVEKLQKLELGSNYQSITKNPIGNMQVTYNLQDFNQNCLFSVNFKLQASNIFTRLVTQLNLGSIKNQQAEQFQKFAKLVEELALTEDLQSF